MYEAYTLAEWSAFLMLGASITSATSIPFWLAVDADLADFDPRPVLETGRLRPVWQAVVDGGHTANRGIALAGLHACQARDRARLAAVALLLAALTHLDPSAPKKGAL